MVYPMKLYGIYFKQWLGLLFCMDAQHVWPPSSYL